MGSSDAEASAKASKTATAAQDQHPTTSAAPATSAYPDWSSFQAYSPIPPHGFFPSPVASSPPPHPYMWGPQPIMPPYVTPPPPYVIYPHGVYAHPSMLPGSHPFSPYAMPSQNGNAEVSGAAQGSIEVNGKSPECKEKSNLKSSKGSLGSLNMITGKNNNDPGKTSGASTNGGISHSGESGSESSSEGSDANSQNDPQLKASTRQDSYAGEEAPQTGNHAHSSQNGLHHTSSQSALNQTMPVMSMAAVGVPGGVADPTTNLHIGMDYWGATTPSPVPPIQAKVPATAVGGAMVHGVPSEMWMQDEREIKRQRRKQSNRESARRSRLRKQGECEELAQQVEVLTEENSSLRAELDRIRKEYDHLLSQDASLKEKLGDTPGGEEDPRVDRNGQHSSDNSHQRPLKSHLQSTQ